jgi:hypothetical protein
VKRIGPMDRTALIAIIGFDVGGPLCFRTIGQTRRRKFVTNVSCGLAVREDQVCCSLGPFNLMMTCNDEKWCRSTLSRIAEPQVPRIVATREDFLALTRFPCSTTEAGRHGERVREQEDRFRIIILASLVSVGSSVTPSLRGHSQ